MPVNIDLKPPIGYIIFNPKQKHNVINKAFLLEFINLLDKLYKENNIKYIVIKSNSENFGVGIDFNELLKSTRDREYAQILLNLLKEAYLKLANSPKLTFAIVEGMTIGAFVEFLLFIDYVIAKPNSRFALFATKYGLIPPAIITVGIKIMSFRSLLKLLYTDEIISADEALRIGLISSISNNPESSIKDIISKISNESHLALYSIKRLIYQNIVNNLDEAFSQLLLQLSTKDVQNAIISAMSKSI
jgi:enoyl-CoA hydratase/carnithine racemase